MRPTVFSTFQCQPRMILPALRDLLVLQHAERLAWEILATEGGLGIHAKRVAGFVAGETAEARVVRVQFCAETRTAFFASVKQTVA
jgi:hypothetical protein